MSKRSQFLILSGGALLAGCAQSGRIVPPQSRLSSSGARLAITSKNGVITLTDKRTSQALIRATRTVQGFTMQNARGVRSVRSALDASSGGPRGYSAHVRLDGGAVHLTSGDGQVTFIKNHPQGGAVFGVPGQPPIRLKFTLPTVRASNASATARSRKDTAESDYSSYDDGTNYDDYGDDALFNSGFSAVDFADTSDVEYLDENGDGESLDELFATLDMELGMGGTTYDMWNPSPGLTPQQLAACKDARNQVALDAAAGVAAGIALLVASFATLGAAGLVGFLGLAVIAAKEVVDRQRADRICSQGY